MWRLIAYSITQQLNIYRKILCCASDWTPECLADKRYFLLPLSWTTTAISCALMNDVTQLVRVLRQKCSLLSGHWTPSWRLYPVRHSCVSPATSPPALHTDSLTPIKEDMFNISWHSLLPSLAVTWQSKIRNAILASHKPAISQSGLVFNSNSQTNLRLAKTVTGMWD